MNIRQHLYLYIWNGRISICIFVWNERICICICICICVWNERMWKLGVISTAGNKCPPAVPVSRYSLLHRIKSNKKILSSKLENYSLQSKRAMRLLWKVIKKYWTPISKRSKGDEAKICLILGRFWKSDCVELRIVSHDDIKVLDARAGCLCQAVFGCFDHLPSFFAPDEDQERWGGEGELRKEVGWGNGGGVKCPLSSSSSSSSSSSLPLLS